MTTHELTRLQYIRAVLIKWTTGKHSGKRYSPEQRQDDLKRLEEIEKQIKSEQ